MGKRYLWETATSAVNSSGVATATFQVQPGQYWAPIMVEVSTRITPSNTSFASSAYCALYTGASTIQDSSTFVDDTFLGSGDCTTVISGAVVQPGQVIVAKWSNGTSGDTAIMRIYGRCYDNLVELQNDYNPIPGTRFAGTTGGGMVWDYNQFSSDAVTTFSTTPTFTTPSDCNIEVISVQAGVTASATAGSRFIGLEMIATINTATITLCNVFNGTAQAVSTTTGYYFNQGVNNSQVGSRYVTALPEKVILPPISAVRLFYSGPDAAGDTWFNFRVSYRRFTSRAKVSYS